MKLWPIVLVILLIPCVLAIRHALAVNELADECVKRTETQQQFLLALRANDVSLCAAFERVTQQRCSAYITNEPSLCAPADLDCIAIASKNATLCVEPICKALASGDTAYCQELADPIYCTNLATLNAEAFVPDKETCKKTAAVPWI